MTHIFGQEEIQLCFNNFFYSNGDSSGLTEPYHTIQNRFEPEKFLYDLAKGKQDKYIKWKNITSQSSFKEYYIEVEKYKIHENYNFIPGNMLPPTSRFFYRLIENGWQQTKFGLYKPGSEIQSFMSKPNEL
jgi:hypothetical protein